RIDDIKPGSLGKVVPGYEAKIVGPDGAEAPEGEIGTLWVKGDSAAVYYWQAHEKSKEVLRGDWVVSADLFSRDADGYFWYAGRADDMLKVSGIFVSPLEIENCLLQHPAVRDVCVIGHTDRDGLVKTKAFVVLHERYTAGETMIEELKIHTKERLAPYKYPRLFEFVPRSEEHTSQLHSLTD